MPERTSQEKQAHEPTNERLLGLAAQIISAYLSHNPMSPADLPAFMANVYQNLSRLDSSAPTAPETRPDPAVPVRRSVAPEYIICLEDGKKLKMLKRHLKTAYNMTPEQYRERWNLPADYPMVAPNYAKQRSKLAKQIGLGTGRRTAKKAA
ncbi:MAG: MucR family transcriptional regulator [Alphaproteobacteria bacterium]|jgi:predicted transcriptional regulator|nr:MucR family transcriptional regulator [Alphaproteobacteria bacterium]